MESRITKGESEKLLTAELLGKYTVQYYRCRETGFIQTEAPYWLEEAYSSAITSLDLGLISRNFKLGEETERIIRSFFNADGRFLDYAGGYGFFTRHMRDKGFDFLHTDRYCENLFARYFELDDCPFPGKFELLTAFEVFEHLADPLTEIGKMFEYADSILFSTEIVPATAPGSIDDWWYFAPETGQHISFYTLKSLEYLAEKFQCNFYTNGITLHLFSKRAFNDNPLMVAPVREKFLLRKLRKWVKKLEAPPPLPRQSLLERDWAFVKNHLKN